MYFGLDFTTQLSKPPKNHHPARDTTTIQKPEQLSSTHLFQKLLRFLDLHRFVSESMLTLLVLPRFAFLRAEEARTAFPRNHLYEIFGAPLIPNHKGEDQEEADD